MKREKEREGERVAMNCSNCYNGDKMNDEAKVKSWSKTKWSTHGMYVWKYTHENTIQCKAKSFISDARVRKYEIQAKGSWSSTKEMKKATTATTTTMNCNISTLISPSVSISLAECIWRRDVMCDARTHSLTRSQTKRIHRSFTTMRQLIANVFISLFLDFVQSNYSSFGIQIRTHIDRSNKIHIYLHLHKKIYIADAARLWLKRSHTHTYTYNETEREKRRGNKSV